MIKKIVSALASSEWLVGDEDIDIAKGLYAIPKNKKERKVLTKRWLLRKQRM